LGAECSVSTFCIFINGWMFTGGFIAAIWNLGLARFRLAIFMLLTRSIKEKKQRLVGSESG